MHLSHHHFTTYLQCKLGSSRSAFSDRLPSPTKEPFAVEKWPKTVCLEADCLPNHPTCCLYESFLARCVITISTSQDHSAWVAQLQIDPDLPVPWCPMQHWRHFCRRNSSSQRPLEPESRSGFSRSSICRFVWHCAVCSGVAARNRRRYRNWHEHIEKGRTRFKHPTPMPELLSRNPNGSAFDGKITESFVSSSKEDPGIRSSLRDWDWDRLRTTFQWASVSELFWMRSFGVAFLLAESCRDPCKTITSSIKHNKTAERHVKPII